MTPSHLGDEYPRVTNMHEVIKEVDELLLLDSFKESLKSSLKRWDWEEEDLRGSGGAQECAFSDLEWEHTVGFFPKEGVDPYL
jgi:hypothetical protein